MPFISVAFFGSRSRTVILRTPAFGFAGALAVVRAAFFSNGPS